MPEPLNRIQDTLQEIFSSFTAAAIELCDHSASVANAHHIHVNTVIFAYKSARFMVTLVNKARAMAQKRKEPKEPDRPASKQPPNSKNAGDSLDCEK